MICYMGGKDWKQTTKLFVVHIVSFCTPQFGGKSSRRSSGGRRRGATNVQSGPATCPALYQGPFTVLLTYACQIDKGTEMLRYGNLLQATQARKRNDLVPKHMLTDSPQSETNHLPLV